MPAKRVSFLFFAGKRRYMDMANTLKIINKAEEKESLTFEEIGRKTGQLVAEKNAKYGDSFAKSGDVLRLYYPHGIMPDQYDDKLAMTRIIDKQFRIATDKDAFGENPWEDITGYGILAQKKDFDKKRTKQHKTEKQGGRP